MRGVPVADPTDMVVSVQVFGVGVELEMLLAELEPCIAQYHGLDDAVGPGFHQFAAALQKRKQRKVVNE